LTVTGSAPATTTTALGTPSSPVAYGQATAVSATVSTASGTPTGTVTLYVDGTAVQTSNLSGGAAAFSVAASIMTVGSHSLTATYNGSTAYDPSSTTASQPLSVIRATLTVTGVCANRVFGAVNSCSANVTGYQYTDSAATVFTATPSGTTTATRDSVSGGSPYTATPVYTLSAFGSTNYTVTPANGSFTIAGGAPQAILFAPLPNFLQGSSYQLTARTTSGLPVTYAVTAGPAMISGNTLTVTGAGTVTVQASQSTDPTGDYAAATPVSRSFTAQ
jgi:hypothetical protein